MTEICYELKIKPEDVSRVFQAVNKRQDGQINFNEFLQASLDCNIIVKEENLRKTFTLLADGSDRISVESLKKVFGVSTTGTSIGDSMWQKMIKEVKGISVAADSESVGEASDEISFEEFKAHMHKVVEQRVQCMKDSEEGEEEKNEANDEEESSYDEQE